VSRVSTVPPEVDAFVEAVAARIEAALEEALTGVYLHGSAAMGGWEAPRSDVDILAVCRRPATAEELEAVAEALTDPSLACPGAGLEFSLVTLESARKPTATPKFELHISTGAAAHTVAGHTHPGDPDLVLHYAVCRERGVTLRGPSPAGVFAQVPRPLILAGLAAEFEWAAANAPPRYQVLNALRAWAFAEDGTLLSKLEAVEWATARSRFAALAAAAWRAQLAGPEPHDAAGIRQLAKAAQEAVTAAV
jgi:streptomycin 3"-adenylyltransferase